MSTFGSYSDWASTQSVGSSDAKLILMLLALDLDTGQPGATRHRLARRAEMPVHDCSRALERLADLGLLKVVGLDAFVDPGVIDGGTNAPVTIYALNMEVDQ